MEPSLYAHETIRRRLDELRVAVETAIDGDILTFMGPIRAGVDGVVRRAISPRPSKRPRLAVLLETGGGVVEIVERMVDTMRHYYKEVVFIIPDRAMSAGTVLALSGDAVYMNYYSVLGPIDPQVENAEGRLIPALAYVTQFERLMAKSITGQLTTAEYALLQKLDLAELLQFEEQGELSISLLKQWLVAFKFKDWDVTEGSKRAVTPDYREKRAKEIAEQLCDHKRWHSHSRGIPMKTLREQLNLRIDDLDSSPAISEAVRAYYELAGEYRTGTKTIWFVHAHEFIF